MAFDVLITDEAFADLDAITDFIKHQASIDMARKWFGAIIVAIETLKEMPGRCPLAPEADELGDDVRFLLHGRRNRAYRIYFKIHQNTESGGSVQVFHVRHWARKPLTNEELEELMDDEQYLANEG
jgi:plasmid stabilization system protein ParE